MTQPEADDVALKFLHTADWHLGKRFPSFEKDDQLKLTRARLEVLDAIFKLAHQHAVDAVFCAGDLFDEPSPDEDWWSGLVAKLAAAPGTFPIFLLPGNHDPLMPGSVYEAKHPFRRKLPARVRVIDTDDFSCDLNELAVLYAKPCRSKSGQDDPAQALPARAGGDSRIRIGMVHGSTFDAVNAQIAFPIAKDAAEKRGFNYLAIGDTHSFRCVPEGAIPPVVYPGAPEPTSFGEPGAGKVVLGFVSRSGRVRYDAHSVAAWTWRQETVRTMAELRLLHAEKLTRTVLRLVVDLRVTAPELEEVDRLLKELKGTSSLHARVGVLLLDRSALRLDSRDIEKALQDVPDVIRAAIQKLKAMEGTEDEDVARRALYQLYQLVREARAS